MRRRTLLATAPALTMVGAASAQDARTVRFIVPNPPGGLLDIVGRLLAEMLSAELGQTVVVDNRPGAAGLLGTGAVATAPADGATVLVTSMSNHVIAPLVQKSTTVDPQRDLAPVGLALRAIGVVVVSAATPANSLKELVALAKARPGKLNFGSSGIGSTNHLALERLSSLAGIELVHVPYKGGAPMVQAVMADEVQLALLDFAAASTALASGKVRAIAQTGQRRHVALPQVPTLAETDYRDFDPSFWVGLAVPRGTPAPAVQRLNTALNRVLGSTAMKARAQANGWTLEGGAPSRLDDTARRDSAALAPEVKRLKL